MKQTFKRTLSVLLTLAMVVSMTGITTVFAAETGSAGTITGFSGYEQTKEVPQGEAADTAALELPETLTATVAKTVDSGEPETNDIALPVTWEGDFDGETPASYPLTATWDPVYAIRDDVAAPVITVTVTPGQDNALPQTITGFPGFDPDSFQPLKTITVEEKSTVEAIGLPDTLAVSIDGVEGDATIPVLSWETMDGSDYEATDYETYDFAPVWDTAAYTLAQGLTDWDVPYITVNIDGAKKPGARDDSGVSVGIEPSDHTFVSAVVGYSEQTAQVFTVENRGSTAINNLSAALGTNSNFEISTALSSATLEPAALATVSVRPKTGLAAGTYTDNLTITSTNGTSSARLSFTVYAADNKVDVSDEAGLKAALAETINPKYTINVTQDIALTEIVTMGAEHTLNIASGKTVTVQGASGINIGGYTLTIEGADSSSTFVCNRTGNSTIFGTNTGKLTLDAVTVNVIGTSALSVTNIDVESGAKIVLDVQNQTQSQLMRVFSLNVAGEIDIQNFKETAILVTGTMTIKSGGRVTVGQGGGENYGIRVDGTNQLIVESGGTLTGDGGIYFVAGAKVTGMSGKLSDQGHSFSQSGEVTVGAADAAAADNQLTAGLYVWDGTDEFVKTGGSLGTGGLLYLRDNSAVTDKYDSEGWKWENNVLTLKTPGDGQKVKCIAFKNAASDTTIKLESDVTLSGVNDWNTIYFLNTAGTLTIETGNHTLTANASEDGVIAILSNGSLVINGGTLNASSARSAINAVQSVTISGAANVTAASTGSRGISAATVTINGGSTVTATGGGNLAAVGSDSGSIAIDNATVTAKNTGSSAAMTKAPTLTNASVTKAAADASGNTTETYNAANIANYKYLEIKPGGSTGGDTGSTELADDTGVLTITSSTVSGDTYYNDEGWKWDGSTLTLKDPNGGTQLIKSIIFDSTGTAATIKLDGNVTLAGAAGQTTIYYGNNSGTLTIDPGSGNTLTANGDIYTINSQANLEIKSGTVFATSTTGMAIRASQQLTISGSANVTAGSTNTNLAALAGTQGVAISTTGTVTSTNTGTAISASSGGITISSGTVNAKSTGSASALFVGNGDIAISGGTVNASSATGTAISAYDGGINVTGGTVTAKCTGDGEYAMAMSPAPTTTKTITASTNSDGSGAATYNAANIASYKYLKIEGGSTGGDTGSTELADDTGLLTITSSTGNVSTYYDTEGWKWDGSTLTLKDPNGADANPVKAVYFDGAVTAATIALDGNVTLAGAAGQTTIYYGNNSGTLTIDPGSHTLTVTATDAFAITSTAALVIDGGTVEATNSGDFNAIHSAGKLTISGGASVTASSTSTNAAALAGEQGVTISTTGTVTATNTGTAISANYGGINVTGGTVNASSATGTAISAYAGGINVTGGTVAATSNGTGEYAMAMSPAPTTTKTITASTNSDGSGEVTYNAANIASYKYLKIEGGSTPAVDTSSIDTAIAAANLAKSGVTTSDSPASSVANGTKFVTTAEMQTLNTAIATAQAAKSTVSTTADAQAAAGVLDTATAAFKTAIKTGTYTGGGGGGGSSDSGSSSGSNTPTVTPSDPDKTDSSTNAKVDVTPKVDAGGGATVNVPEKSVSDAIKAAQDAAKKAGTTENGIAITIDATTGKDAGSITATLPEKSVDALIAAGAKTVEIKSDAATISLDLATLKAAQAVAGGPVTVSAQPVAASALSAEAKAAIGDRPVFQLTLQSGGKSISSFGGGSVSVGLPYTLQAGEKAGNLYGVYVDDAGKVTYLMDSSYDAQSKTLLFSTSHFSTFGVGYKADVTVFTDITGHWAKDDIEFVAARGLLSGTGSNQFNPNTGMTRGMFVTALGRLAGVSADSYKTGKFSDVRADAYYAPYVNWAAEKGVVSGTTATTFAPDQPVTRQQMAVIMANYAKAMNYTVPKTREAVTFTDSANIASWAKDAVKAMQMAGVIMGKDGNRFDPTGTATRAEVAVVLHRYVELVIDPATAQGWEKNDSGVWMYYEDGKAVTGEKTIDGTTYHFDAKGLLTKIDAIAPETKKYITHVIVYGDTLWDLAIEHGCTVAEIVSLNGIENPNSVPVGTEIKIPQK